MKQPPDWALEIARQIYLSHDDSPSLDLMAPPYGFDADTAIGVYDALVWLHEEELEID